MKHLCLSILAAFLAVAAALFFFRRDVPRPKPPPTIVSQGPTVERLERLNRLVTTRVHVADVLVGTDDDCAGAWLIKGDALIAVNLGRARIIEKNEEFKQAVLCLPSPEVLQSRVDHERSRTWEVKRTTWVPWRGDQDKLRDYVMLHAQRLVAQTAGSPDNIKQARQTAEATLQGFYREVDWQVRVIWEGDPTKPPSPPSNAPKPGQ